MFDVCCSRNVYHAFTEKTKVLLGDAQFSYFKHEMTPLQLENDYLQGIGNAVQTIVT